MRASEARAIMEAHLGEFFEVSPGDVPTDLVEDISPLFAMGLARGLRIASARRYVEWLQDTGRVSEWQAAGLQSIVDVTEEFVERAGRK